MLIRSLAYLVKTMFSNDFWLHSLGIQFLCFFWEKTRLLERKGLKSLPYILWKLFHSILLSRRKGFTLGFIKVLRNLGLFQILEKFLVLQTLFFFQIYKIKPAFFQDFKVCRTWFFFWFEIDLDFSRPWFSEIMADDLDW